MVVETRILYNYIEEIHYKILPPLADCHQFLPSSIIWPVCLFPSPSSFIQSIGAFWPSHASRSSRPHHLIAFPNDRLTAVEPMNIPYSSN
jgi:hypothetical protein